MDNINMVHDDAFIDQLSLYQSANNSNEVIKQNFIVRKQELETIINSLKNKKAEDPLQHELILGRRGSGKSTLLKRIQIEIEENPELQKKYIAINLAEEQASVYRLSDLWYEVLKELHFKFKKESALKEFSSFANNNDYTFYLYDLIHSLLVTEHKKAVLLLDNLDRILQNFNEDANALREILLNYNEIQIIGGSTRMDEHFWRYDKPFYEFFRRHRLEGLTFKEINLLLNNWSLTMHLPLLKDYAIKNRGKIEALRILTDGLPRALQFFIQVLVNDSTLYGFAYLKKVMDKATPLYQERLNNLTPPQRKIIQEMAFIWEACSTKQLVEACRMEGKLISSYLKQIQKFGIIETITTKTKNHLYRISERFFNMWIIVTQGNPNQKRNAKYLTLFLETFYDSNELKTLAQKHIDNLNAGKYNGDKVMLLSKAYSQSKHISTKERDTIIKLTYNVSEKDNSFLNELPQLYSDLRKDIFVLIENREFDKALELTSKIENEEDGIKFFIKGYIFGKKGSSKETEKYYLVAIEKGNTNASYNLAILYKDQGKFKLAEKYYLVAIEKGNTNALNNLANLYKDQGKFELAEKYYLVAIEKGNTNALKNLAILYKDQGKIELAEKYYLVAIEKGNTDALNNLGILYKNQGKFELAEKYYLDAIEKGNTDALNNLANLYIVQGKFELAEKYYLVAIEKGNTNALKNLAILYKDQGEFELAEKYYLVAIEKGNTDALNNLGILYKNQRKFELAEKYYLDAIEKGNTDALNNLAILFKDQGKFELAEKYYLVAIEKGVTVTSNNLAILFKDQGKFELAEKHYLDAIEKGNTDALNNLAILYKDQGKFELAEKYYLVAIEKGVTVASNNLAILFKDQGKFVLAEKYYLIAIEKGNTDALNNLGILYKNQGKFELSEKYYLSAIEKGNTNALNNLIALFFNLNKNKKIALEMINNALLSKIKIVQAKKIIINIWNNIFTNVENDIESFLQANGYNNFDDFFLDLLYLEQTQLVLNLFENEKHKEELQSRYTPLYYAVRILANKDQDNLLLKIPPEIQETVDQLIALIKEKQEFYRQPSK